MVSGSQKPLDLTSEGARALITLTNQQFQLWGECLRDLTTDEIPAGNLMDYWFILSALASLPPRFQMRKKESFTLIPNLGEESVRKYVSWVERHGFVETVKSRGVIYVRLTETGQTAVATTLGRWLHAFTSVRRRHFAPEPPLVLPRDDGDDGTG